MRKRRWSASRGRTNVCVNRIDQAIVVAVEEVDVLLEHRPVVRAAAITATLMMDGPRTIQATQRNLLMLRMDAHDMQ